MEHADASGRCLGTPDDDAPSPRITVDTYILQTTTLRPSARKTSGRLLEDRPDGGSEHHRVGDENVMVWRRMFHAVSLGSIKGVGMEVENHEG